MPTLDGEDKVVGSLLREDTESGNYTRCFTVLDFSVYKLRLYHEDAEVAIMGGREGDFPIITLLSTQSECNYRPIMAVLNSEVNLFSGTHFSN